MCLSHRDFGVPVLSFGKLIPPPAALCVCVGVLVARFGSLYQPIARSFQTTIPVTQSSRGYRPSHPVLTRRIDPLVRMPRDEASRSPQVFVLFGGGFVSRHPVRGRPSLRG